MVAADWTTQLVQSAAAFPDARASPIGRVSYQRPTDCTFLNNRPIKSAAD